jgi:predicted membrane protein
VNNTGIKYVRIMKQTAFWREKNGEYFLIDLLHTVYTKCTKVSYKIVPATNFTTQVPINKWKRIVWLWIEVKITAVKNDRKNTAANGEYTPCLKYSVPIFVE